VPRPIDRAVADRGGAPTRYRVLLVHSSAGRYGADRQLELLARTLDHECLALLPFEGPLSEDLRAGGTEVLIGDLAVLRRELLTPAGLARLSRDVARARPALRKLIAAQRIDIVHANTSVILGLRAVAPKLVTHVREIYPRTPLAWPLQRRAILRSDAVVCVSDATRAALGGGTVVHDGLAVIPERAPRAEARLALGLPPGAFVAAVLGRISAWKGQQLLADACTRIGAVALVAGDAWPGQERTLTGAHEVGFRDDVGTVLGAADVVVVPSTRPDPFPNSALEAAAAGCCVVAAAHGGLPEIVRDGETGRLFPPGDADALAAVLAELRDDPAQVERLGEAAAVDIRARFTPERMATAVSEIYAQVRRTAR
jgi:glycosyltransferase involved in cell wall biosynthesis